jgi:acetoin utilization deacetylase AcuC-like enzyme
LALQRGHVTPERLDATRALDETGMRDRLVALTPQPMAIERLARVHQSRHIERVRSVAARGGGGLQGLGDETYVAPRSYDAALLAAGAVVTGVEAVLRSEVKNAFALVRPPGHHAFADHGEGFCLFNNIAIAAAAARTEFQMDRVMIVDFDVHHGNGTNAIFYRDPSVLYFSTHQWGIYPGTGYWDEVGEGAGVAIVSMCPGWGDEALRVSLTTACTIARRFQPQLLLVSAGYDPVDRSADVARPRRLFNLTRDAGSLPRVGGLSFRRRNGLTAWSGSRPCRLLGANRRRSGRAGAHQSHRPAVPGSQAPHGPCPDRAAAWRSCHMTCSLAQNIEP